MCHSYHPTYAWTCSACQRSGSITLHYDGERWTDGELRGLVIGELEQPTLVRCPACNALERATGLDWAADPSLPELQHPSEDDYLQALEAGLYASREEKLDLRLRAWRSGNDASRVEGARAQIRSAEAQANLEALYELLCEDPLEALTKAEVARQLGRFEESLELLNGLSRLTQASDLGRTLARLAREGSDAVAAVSWERYGLHYTCPHCDRPGRVSQTYDERNAARYEFDAALSPMHAVRCGSCRGAFWRGGQERSDSLWLESLSDGGVAELGCCLAFPVAIGVAIVSPRAAAAVLLTYFALILLSELAGVVRKCVYPDSRRLTDMDFEELLEARAWNGVEEERWVRLSVFYARTREPAARCGLDANALALIRLFGESPEELWLEAKVRRRAGDVEGAREVAGRLQASGNEWYAKRGEHLLEKLDRGEPPERRAIRW
jgi:hypothetical protein